MIEPLGRTAGQFLAVLFFGALCSCAARTTVAAPLRLALLCYITWSGFECALM